MTAFETVVDIFAKVSNGIVVKSQKNLVEMRFRILEGFSNLNGNISANFSQVEVTNANGITTITGPDDAIKALFRDVIFDQLAFYDPEDPIPIDEPLLIKLEDNTHKIGVYEGELIIIEGKRFSPYSIEAWYPINKLI